MDPHVEVGRVENQEKGVQKPSPACSLCGRVVSRGGAQSLCLWVPTQPGLAYSNAFVRISLGSSLHPLAGGFRVGGQVVVRPQIIMHGCE